MIDPVKLSRETEKIVCKDENEKKKRKYYRFRDTRFYGGVATGDCLGCNLRCLFCWAWSKTNNPETQGEHHTAEESAERLIGIARENNHNKARLSGNEPTIGKEHLLQLLTEIQDTDLEFILETNGILIGEDPYYAEELSEFKDFIRARVSIKGCNPKQFSKLTQAKPEGFKLQLNSLKNLLNHGIDSHPAVMISFSTTQEINQLREKLTGINPYFVNFEPEEVKNYGGAYKRLEKEGIKITKN